MNRAFFYFSALALPLSIFAEGYKEQDCPNGKRHYRATIRHIESGGIGYEDGYTTFEAFLCPDPSRFEFTPFIDVRGHIFDHGKWAANAGIGLRTLRKNRAYGANVYYDYRNTGRFNSNQIGLGIETLGEIVDFRINGYLPICKKNSDPYEAVFKAFSGNYMLISQKYQAAMKGADAEFGFHFGKFKSFDFYAAAGPYYFIGENAPSTWGGKGRISATYKDILTFEISDSYDRTFHNKFQGQLSLGFSFGPKSKIKKQNRSCTLEGKLNDRMLQQVDRQEIIVIDNTRKQSVAINPLTKTPYFFVFVNNTSSSNGTYESPYHTLAQAQESSSANDIIYLFPGDGTTTGMNSGIFLKAGQKFWGSGINHSLQTSEGSISIPAQSSSYPTITNTNIATEGDAITLATDNAISGIKITSALRDAIYGADPQNVNISSCIIENTTTYTIEASFSGNASISLTNNQFLNNENGIFLTLNGTSNLVCLENTFKGQTSISSIPLEISANTNTFISRIENNLFEDNTTGSIRFDLHNVISADITALNNTITNNGTGSQSSLGSSFTIITDGTTEHCSLIVKNNIFSENTGNALYLHTSGQITTLDVTASANTMSNNGGSALVVATPIDTLTLLAMDNTIIGSSNSGIALISSAVTSTGDVTIKNNIIKNIMGGANGISIGQDFSTLDLTILNNEIDNCEGSGILSYSPTGIDLFRLNISDNTISNCQNLSSNAASGIDIEQFTSLGASVTNNRLSNNTGLSVIFGSTLTSPTACLTLKDNSNSEDYFLNNPFDGVFNLTPCNVDLINTGVINTSGVVTHVQSCSNPTPCPSE